MREETGGDDKGIEEGSGYAVKEEWENCQLKKSRKCGTMGL